MLVSRGGWTWTALTWKHFQHSILGEMWCWDELQETQPRQGLQSICVLTHPTWRAPFTWGINSEDKHEGKPHILKMQRERIHVSPTTWHSRTWSPVSSDYETFVPTRRWPSWENLKMKPKSLVHNTLQVLTRNQAFIFGSERTREE